MSKFIINKQHLILTTFYILLFLFLLSPLFTPGVPVTHDGDAHMVRFGAYVKAFKDGQFPPLWAGDLNFGYGSPVFLFYYPLPGYIASLIHFTGINLELTYKLILGASFLLLPVTFYIWVKQLFSQRVALVISLLYGLVPYHFLDLYVRGDMAELLSLVCIPLVLAFLEKNKVESHYKNIFLGGLFYALAILMHNGISLLFSPVVFFYMLVITKNKNLIFKNSFVFILGLGISAYFWLPALYEGKYVNAHLFIGSMYKEHFPSLLSLLYSPWGFGDNINKPGGLSAQIGIFYFLLFIGGYLAYLKSKKKNPQLLFWITVFVGSCFLTNSVSTYFWEVLPLIKLFQFPWRLIAVASFAGAVVGGYFIQTIKKQRDLFIVLGIGIIISLFFVQVKGYAHNPDSYYYSYPGTTYFHGEASSIWTAGDFSVYPKNRIEVIGGKAEIKPIERKSQRHIYKVVASENSRFLDNTVYFPGWKVFVDGKKTPIEFQDINHRGLMTFSVPRGEHIVKVVFDNSPIRNVAQVITVLTICSMCGFIFYKKLRLIQHLFASGLQENISQI